MSGTSDRVGPARELLERCGVGDELGDDEAVRRADEIAAAVAEDSRSTTDRNAAVLDEHLRAEFELNDADATMETMGPGGASSWRTRWWSASTAAR